QLLPAVDRREEIHPRGGVGRREATLAQRAELGLELGEREPQPPRRLDGRHVARVDPAADRVGARGRHGVAASVCGRTARSTRNAARLASGTPARAARAARAALPSRESRTLPTSTLRWVIPSASNRASVRPRTPSLRRAPRARRQWPS